MQVAEDEGEGFGKEYSGTNEISTLKQSRHPFQELPVLPEDYGKESDGGDVHKEIVEESQLIDEGEGEDGD